MDIIKSLLFNNQRTTNFIQRQEVRLIINKEKHAVKINDITPDMTLNSYLREKVNLRGTKKMCLEGGCGACIVVAAIKDPVTKREEVLAVNSCLVPIYLCSGWKISTPESIGNSTSGYHPVQKALVQFNGTQCGFCSSGMVMNMYALYETGKFNMKEVENAFGGNMCRCTGYRPILSAFKSLAADASWEIIGSYSDIEDIPICIKSGKCKSSCESPCDQILKPHFYDIRGHRWYKVFSINEIFDIIRAHPQNTYKLVGGNTATGVYKTAKEPNMYIDITNVENLLGHTLNTDNLVLGANITLRNTMDLFYTLAKEHKPFSYLNKLADHIDLIANVPVRNIGTLAGNLFIKHQHHEFPSDIYLLLESVGANLTIVGTDHKEVTISLVDFLSFDLHTKIIKSITLPALENCKYESYKIMPRAQNAHALVNAAFLFKLDTDNKIQRARIVYGGINPSFTHATKAEIYLFGKSLFDNETLQGLFKTLDAEIVPDHVLPDPSPEFRKQLAISLCYKFILSVTPDSKISSRNKSGAKKLSRPISSGTQDYQTNESLYPLTQPISKIEALAQCAGTAEYIMDIPDRPGQLFGAFVLAKAPAYSIIRKIDTSDAMKVTGVVAFYDKNDIPGENNFMPSKATSRYYVVEEIFCSGVVKYYFQPVGLIVASSQATAEKAAEMVEITYMHGEQKPLFTIRDILAANATQKIFKEGEVKPKNKGTDIKHVIKGKFDIFWQYHYHMETQCCVVIPVEGELDVYPSTQSLNVSQVAMATVLNIPENKINVKVRRLGGAYGAKISRNNLISCAAALAAYKLQKPVKLSMPFTTNMNIIGKRYPFSADYEVGLNNKGVIQYLNSSLYIDFGSQGGNENFAAEIATIFGNMYNRDTWAVSVYSTRTDTHTGTPCRAPWTTESIASSESIIQHIASELKLDPLVVRLQNISKNNPEINKYIEDLKTWAEVDKRKAKVEAFNKTNRWVKKGISVVPMLYPLIVEGYLHVHIAIYQGDGTVSLAHGGVEMGQGINTKVAQVCAQSLGIPLDMVRIKPNDTLISPNSRTTASSTTSEIACCVTLRACEILNERMRPIKEKMKNPTWLELVQKCYMENLDLCISHLLPQNTPDLKSYPIYGVTCAEVEIDILTGQHQIKRVDILEDVGDSMSPQIDIGQVEGAFVMGMGYWTSEQIVFSKDGELLTNRTWTYKPPGAKDIPVDFRVKFPKNNPNPLSVLKSKATAEPPLCMTCAIPFAIRSAVASARADANPKAQQWYPMNGPSTVESTFINSLNDYNQYML